MKIPLIATALAALLVPLAHAGVPLLNAQCPGNLSVHADEGGPVYINGQQAQLKRFNDNYYEARDPASGVTVSISNAPDGSSTVTYTGPGHASGVCHRAGASAARDTPPETIARGAGQYPAAAGACLDAVARETGVARSQLRLADVAWAQAGVGVMVAVPGAQAPWSCLSSERGEIQSRPVYTGTEGRE